MAKTEMKILIGLNRAVNTINRRSTKILSAYDLTLGQFAVLEVLYHKGAMTIGQVQGKILSSSGTMPLIVSNLEKRGYIIRQADCKDRRRCILDITDKAKELVSFAYPQNEKEIIEMMKIWTDEEKEQLSALLKKFGGN
jgi:MarR family 2-MHQ and catechol resistance regulon transcriptional repressor